MIIKESSIRAKNSAMIAAAGRRNVKSMSLTMFTQPENAAWSLQWALAEASYPLASVKVAVGRKGFALKPGDLFPLTYTPFGISDMVVRVLSVEEESLDSERINLTVIEAIEYVATIPGVSVASGLAGSTAPDYAVVALTHVAVREPPFIYAETPNTIIPIMARETGTETGALVFISVDGGTSYSRLGVTRTFSVYGALTSLLADDGDSFSVDIGLDSGRLSTDANAHAKLTNLILIDDEIISFETITPVDDDSFTISGLLRGVYGTAPAEHASGAAMYRLDGLARLTSPMLTAGETYHFKMVPFNAVNTGDISEATAVSLAFRNLSMLPYAVESLTANGSSSDATYTGDIALAWDPRVRGSNDTPGDLLACEGLFEVRVIVGGTTVRTARTTTADPFFNAWTYTAAMNQADNGGALANAVTFQVYNYIDSARYSDAAAIGAAAVGQPDGITTAAPVMGTPGGSAA